MDKQFTASEVRAPSDAERLAEALREQAAKWVGPMYFGMSDENEQAVLKACANDVNKILAAHSAQAQPPAARVPDAMPKVPVNADEVEFGCLRSLEDACWNAGWNACRDAMLAAQESLNG